MAARCWGNSSKRGPVPRAGGCAHSRSHGAAESNAAAHMLLSNGTTTSSFWSKNCKKERRAQNHWPRNDTKQPTLSMVTAGFSRIRCANGMVSPLCSSSSWKWTWGSVVQKGHSEINKINNTSGDK